VSISQTACHHCGRRLALTALEKECPDCCSAVDVRARVCPFCTYEFVPARQAETLS
jgi:predicted amidophosphoribosyltransferase